jgi:hypothetical protein
MLDIDENYQTSIKEQMKNYAEIMTHGDKSRVVK